MSLQKTSCQQIRFSLLNNHIFICSFLSLCKLSATSACTKCCYKLVICITARTTVKVVIENDSVPSDPTERRIQFSIISTTQANNTMIIINKHGFSLSKCITKFRHLLVQITDHQLLGLRSRVWAL